MLLFYTTAINLNTITLDENDSKHAVKVLRLQSGNQVHAVDGKGNLFECEIKDAHPKKCTLNVLQTNFQENPYAQISIAVAPTKNNNRYEWFLEKATEIGIGSIFPIITKNSERKVINGDRMKKVIIAAMKQSLKSYLPVLNAASTLKELIISIKDKEINLLIAHCYSDISKADLTKVVDKKKSTLLLIGPEGDFSQNEVQYALDNGFQSVTLGNTRLRTETAAIVACTKLNMLYE